MRLKLIHMGLKARRRCESVIVWVEGTRHHDPAKLDQCLFLDGINIDFRVEAFLAQKFADHKSTRPMRGACLQLHEALTGDRVFSAGMVRRSRRYKLICYANAHFPD
jgi:hypothetical protein